MNIIEAMTEERAKRIMGNLMNQYDQGLLSLDSLWEEIEWVLEERRDAMGYGL